jgi:beta-glucosidase-like glycosyl hydrolase
VSELAQLLLPAIRWDRERGYDGERAQIERALSAGVGGFILFGGVAAEVIALTTELRRRSTVPLLIAADLERGAGQQFDGATGLPPLAAIASLGDQALVREAARLTARESRRLGVSWDFAPVCDVDLEPANPIIGTRAFGTDFAMVTELAAEWIDGCQSLGVLACAKHFPGHGRTTGDSHAALPIVGASQDALYQIDLAPFRASIDAGVAAVMTAHVAYPALDASGTPATLSRQIVHRLLRGQLRFDGLVITDALIMQGVLEGRDEADACIAALAAGCDLLCYPTDIPGTVRAIDRAAAANLLDREALHQSLQRRLRAAERAALPDNGPVGLSADVAWADALALRTVHAVRGSPPIISKMIDLVIVDDDVGGPYPSPSRQPFVDALRDGGAEVRVTDSPSRDPRRSTVVALFGDIRSWKGRPGYSPASRDAVGRACATTEDALIVQFSHPRLAAEIAGRSAIVSGWGGERVMQRAAARWILRGP